MKKHHIDWKYAESFYLQGYFKKRKSTSVIWQAF